MIGKSLANDFQYTKLKYKQYLYFSLNIPLMFLLFFLFSLFLSLCFSFVYLNFYLMYYQDNNTQHHKVIYPPYSRNCQVLQKKMRKQTKIFLFLATKRLCSLLITGRHYSLLVTHLSSRSLVNVNYKYVSEEIYPVLLKQQSIKSSTTKSCCKLYHYLQSAQNPAN